MVSRLSPCSAAQAEAALAHGATAVLLHVAVLACCTQSTLPVAVLGSSWQLPAGRGTRCRQIQHNTHQGLDDDLEVDVGGGQARQRHYRCQLLQQRGCVRPLFLRGHPQQ